MTPLGEKLLTAGLFLACVFLALKLVFKGDPPKTTPPEPVLEEELPDACRPWKRPEPKPPSKAPGPDDFPAGDWAHLACPDSGDGCITKAQANAWRFDIMDSPSWSSFSCDYDAAMMSEQMFCTGEKYDTDFNQVGEAIISCPTTWFAECSLVEFRPVFVPHTITTIDDMIEIYKDTCANQRERLTLCSPWCDGEDPHPECTPHWNVVEGCDDLQKYQYEAARIGGDAFLFFERPETP